MTCVNPNNPQYKKILTKVGNPILAELEMKDILIKERNNIRTVYQGYTGKPDTREFNYFTLDEDEARNYGSTVRKVSINTTGFFDVNSSTLSSFSELRKEFTSKTGKVFDLLDNRPEQLKVQTEFFRFMKNKGYNGLNYLDNSDSQYIITFNPVEDSPVQTGNETLNELLIHGFLKDFGITVTEYESLKDELGFNAYAMADFLGKAIAYEKGESIIPEVAYFAFNMLGKQNNKIKSELRFLINKWDRYQERFDYHKSIISAREGFISDKKEWRNKVRDLVILDFLREKIEQYYKNPTEFEKILDTKWTREDFTLWQKILDAIEKFLLELSKLTSVESKARLDNLGLGIADEIINRNYVYFDYDLGQDQVRKYYKTTIESDPFAKELVEFGQKELGMVLTGSLALRRAGSVYRTADETLHDIDWVVPYDLMNTKEDKKILNSILRGSSPSYRDSYIDGLSSDEASKKALIWISQTSWFQQFYDKYPTFEFTNGFYGGEHKKKETFTVQGVVNGEFYQENGYHEEEYKFYRKDPKTKRPIINKGIRLVKHKKGQHIKGTGYALDFFVRLTPYQEEHDNYFKLWKEIFIAKLKMARDKDFIDWKAWVPYLKSQDSYNFKYRGWRHINWKPNNQRNPLEDTQIDNVSIPYEPNDDMISFDSFDDWVNKTDDWQNVDNNSDNPIDC